MGHNVEYYPLVGHNMQSSTAFEKYIKSGLFKLGEGEWNGYAFHHPRGTILGCVSPEGVLPTWIDKLIAIETERLGERFDGCNLPRGHAVYTAMKELYNGEKS